MAFMDSRMQLGGFQKSFHLETGWHVSKCLETFQTPKSWKWLKTKVLTIETTTRNGSEDFGIQKSRNQEILKWSKMYNNNIGNRLYIYIYIYIYIYMKIIAIYWCTFMSNGLHGLHGFQDPAGRISEVVGSGNQLTCFKIIGNVPNT